MSAKIYSVPKEFSNIPQIWDYLDNQSEYDKLIHQWYEDLKNTIKKYNPHEDQNYIGEIVKWNVADGYAEYMVCSLKPLKLIHLPIGDAYEYWDAKLQTVKSIKEQIDGRKRWLKFMDTQCTVGEVNEALKIGLNEGIVETTDMASNDISKFDVTSIGLGYRHIKWQNRTYMVPIYSNKQTYNHKVYKYLLNNFKINN